MTIRKIDDTINEPFWSAGQQFNWPGNRTGIGLHERYFQNIHDLDLLEVKIIVSDKEKKYRIPVGKAKTLVKQYNSYWKTKDGTRLLIVPFQEFEAVDK